MIEITVFAAPAPQGSKQPWPVRSGSTCPSCSRRKLAWRPGTFCYTCREGVPVITMSEMAQNLALWRSAVFAAARVVMVRTHTLAGPVEGSMTFSVGRPKSHLTKSGALSAEGKRNPYPDSTPDLSKLLRATEDSLTEAKVWEDDARVVRYSPLEEVWAGEPGALHKPGVVIRLRELIPPQQELELDLSVSETRRRPGHSL